MRALAEGADQLQEYAQPALLQMVTPPAEVGDRVAETGCEPPGLPRSPFPGVDRSGAARGVQDYRRVDQPRERGRVHVMNQFLPNCQQHRHEKSGNPDRIYTADIRPG